MNTVSTVFEQKLEKLLRERQLEIAKNLANGSAMVTRDSEGVPFGGHDVYCEQVGRYREIAVILDLMVEVAEDMAKTI